MANVTTSVDGPAVLREYFAPRVAQRGYVVQNLGDTDERLRGIGINLGGQVPGVKIAELRKALGTDAAIGGTLLKHGNIVLGIANQQTLEAEIVMVDLTNGRILDRQRRKVVHQEDFGRGGGNAAGALIGGAIGVASGVSRNSLKKESDQLSLLFANYLPRPGMGYPPYGAEPPPTAAAPTGATGTGPAPTPVPPLENAGDAVWPPAASP